jgi:hypothetical protein
MGMGTDKDKAVFLSYCGEHEHDSAAQRPKPADSNPIPPSPEAARAIALRVLEGAKGRMLPTQHYQERMEERNFDVLDIEYVIRNGACKAHEFVPEKRQHKYTFSGHIDGKALRQCSHYRRTTT